MKLTPKPNEVNGLQGHSFWLGVGCPRNFEKNERFIFYFSARAKDMANSRIIIDLCSSSSEDEKPIINVHVHRYKYNMNEASVTDVRGRAREYDVRVNLDPEFENTQLKMIEKTMKQEFYKGTLCYGHVSGIEVGDRPDAGSFGKRHVHMALVYKNNSTLGAVQKKYGNRWNTNYYCTPRNKKLPRNGWIKYHAKERTKVKDEPGLRFVLGEFNVDEAQEEKNEDVPPAKRKKYEEWERKKQLIREDDIDGLDREFPGVIQNAVNDQLFREKYMIESDLDYDSTQTCICEGLSHCLCKD